MKRSSSRVTRPASPASEWASFNLGELAIGPGDARSLIPIAADHPRRRIRDRTIGQAISSSTVTIAPRPVRRRTTPGSNRRARPNRRAES